MKKCKVYFLKGDFRIFECDEMSCEGQFVLLYRCLEKTYKHPANPEPVHCRIVVAVLNINAIKSAHFIGEENE